MASSIDSKTPIKFLCSYGGKLVPRYPDGKLRYQGGQTRVLAVHRSVSFSELLTKLREFCGGAMVSLRCQLPPEADLDDALVSIVSDEDLANLIEEYDRSPVSSSSLKIRAFLSPPSKKQSPAPSSTTSSSSSSSSSSSWSSSNTFAATIDSPRCYRRQIPRAPVTNPARKFPPPSHHYGGHVYLNLVHNGNHWQ
ncbi:unnamed protein product [Linum trigynum]|uniref:PB1 domain-containing protein n=1 Tax=Linum trigynum TaxID=586398 RepID=A0AAV2FAL3_9ROSI